MDPKKDFYYTSLAIAVNRILQYIRRSDVKKGETFFSDPDGVYFETDMGYFIEGLEGLADALDEKIGD